MKILLDTNIIIDNLARRDEYGESLQVLNLCENRVCKGIITTITVMDVMYILRKHLTSSKLRDAIQMLMQIVEVVPVLKSDIDASLLGEFSDFEDAVQASCAKREKADYIVTRNIKHFKKSPVPAVLPADIIRLLAFA